MNEEILTEIIERINSDPQFRADVQTDPITSLSVYQLRDGPANIAVDEDALRRLSSVKIDQDARFWTWVKKQASRLFCGPGKTRSWECPSAPTQR